MPCRNQHWDMEFRPKTKYNKHPRLKRAGMIQSETKPKTLVHGKALSSQTYHVHSTHPGGKLPPHSQKRLCLHLSFTEVKEDTCQGESILYLFYFKIYLSGVSYGKLAFQDLRAYVLKCFNKKKLVTLGVHWLITYNHCHIYWVLKIK